MSDKSNAAIAEGSDPACVRCPVLRAASEYLSILRSRTRVAQRAGIQEEAARG